MTKPIVRCVLFLVIFAMLFALLSPLFVPKNNAEGVGLHEGDAKGFLAEPTDSIDVLFLGDSEVFSAFIPLQIWKEHGITSYLCSTANQVMYQSYAYLKRFFDYHTPKIVILETNALFREYTVADIFAYTMEDAFPYLRYHDRWKTLRPEDWTEEVSFRNLIRDKGYTFRTRAIPASTEGYMVPSEEIYVVPLLNQWYFHLIQEFCNDQGATLMLVSTPSPTNWDYYYHNGIVQLLEGTEIPYLDMNLMQEEIPIDWDTESYDGGDHLNYAGACKATGYIGTLLWETGQFEDKRELDHYAPWNHALADFEAAVSANSP